MDIIDSQVHIWGANTPERPWPAVGSHGRAPAQREVPLGADELIRVMDAAGVKGVVIVPPTWEGERNDLAIDAVKRYPGRFAIMGRIDMSNPSNLERIPDWRKQPGMMGIRMIIRKGDAWLEQGSNHWLWGAAEKAGVRVTMAILRTHGLIEEIATKHPGLKLSVDHMGAVPGAKTDEAFVNLPALLKLARLPNVAVKASCAPATATDDYPFKSVHDYVHQLFDAFGPKRLFWGSDFSRLPPNATYKQCQTMFTEEMPWLKGEDLEWVMGRGVCEWFGWKR